MTTSVENNLVFKSFFEKQKLTGPKFINWYRQLWLVLSTEDKEKYLEQPILAAPVDIAPDKPIPRATLAAYNEWVKTQKEVMVLMLLSMDLEIQRNLAHLGAYDMLQELKALYSKQAEQEFLQTNYNMQCIGNTMNELHAMLKMHEETLPKKVDAPRIHAIRAKKVQNNKNKKPLKAAKGVQGKGKSKLVYALEYKPSYARKPKNPPPPKKDNPAKDVICHQCGEVGCWRRNCLVYLAELLKKKKLSQKASTSGVEAIGIYHLCIPSALVIVLKNCHYAPSITRGIISVSRLYDHGFLNYFDLNNAISFSKNNVVYFYVVPRDGIYEINLNSSNTNDSSMYVVSNKRAKLNLDSSLLWHSRLGHINKKRIEKLQHDGLLNYTDNESLGKCVSCMSGKMASKSYSHQVKRDKDLLGLIHIDDYALEFAAHILNMVPTNKVEKTPYEIRHGQALKLSYLKVWGCKALVKRETLSKPNKLEPRSIKCIFVGYPKETIRYSFYYPPENKVFVARNAEFFESNLIDQKASESLEDLEIFQEEDTSFFRH
nr:zinc finger, CCHC-type [Tanacetum cinerariifolium]